MLAPGKKERMYQWNRWSHSGVILSQIKNAPQTMYADDIQQKELIHSHAKRDKSGFAAVPVESQVKKVDITLYGAFIRGPKSSHSDIWAFNGHRITTQKGSPTVKALWTVA
ncbi:uncharacterized protein MCYG_05941 [Microsporum canis CBS 113480]|uniref:Uncharacterized protein n=1 Tax=Arthroderma otae (strain ATCC MYA-4605 / CBS 113480) TaxID=554155 RepID=C5FTB9_ARTOC|nr:uncharacterized protein MCYG_05941 [Microsporum canis CBS 113480]EEQ33122.1 predicted protein [Microsporum canis CBS 113480]